MFARVYRSLLKISRPTRTFTAPTQTHQSNVGNQKIEVPIKEYIDDRVSSGLSELKSLIEATNLKIDKLKGEIIGEVTTKMFRTFGIVFTSGGGLFALLASMGVKATPPQVYLEKKDPKT